MRWRLIRAVLPVMAMLTLGVILGFFQSEQTPGELAANPDQVRVVIPNHDYELEPKAVVEIQNIGHGHVEILDVTASCGCTVATLAAHQLPADGKTKLEITINRPLPVGKKASVVTVAYVADSPKTLRIPIEITVDEPAEPRFLTAPVELSLNSANQLSHVFQIEVKEPTNSSPLLTSIRCSDHRLDAHLAKPPESHPWDEAFVVRTYEIEASTKSPLDEAEFGGYLMFEFSKPVLEVRDVPILVKHQPTARAIPSSVEYELNSETVFPIKRKLYVVSKTPGDQWQIESADSQPVWLRVELENSPQKGNLTPLNLEITDAVRGALGTNGECVAQIRLRLISDGSTVAIPLKFR